MSTLDQDRWCSMTFVEQMANIGSEVGRTGKWIMKGKPQLAMGAFYRAYRHYYSMGSSWSAIQRGHAS